MFPNMLSTRKKKHNLPITSKPISMTSPKQWWKRATAMAKDKRSLCLTKVAGARRRSGGGQRNPDLEAAIIRATSHDERAVDYKNAGRVFTWARTSPAFIEPLMWALSRRVERTRSWIVALKGLMLAHGVLLCSDTMKVGRLPFDISDFRDRSSNPSKAWGFSAFVRAYFNFLDQRSAFLNCDSPKEEEEEEEEGNCGLGELERLERMQVLLDLLMQIRPYADGMDVGLILEAMDCVVIEIFEVYSGICNGIACFLVGILGSSSSKAKEGEEEMRRKGVVGIRVLRKASQQSSQLSSYFEVCKGLGVLNATELPSVERIPEEDIRDLERLVMGGIEGNDENLEEKPEGVEGEEKQGLNGCSGTVVTQDWVVFEDELGYSWNPFLSSSDGSWQLQVQIRDPPPFGNSNLIELI